MATETLISKSPLKPEQVTRIKGEYPMRTGPALEYEKALREYFTTEGMESIRRFDLVLRNGHEGTRVALPWNESFACGGRIAVRKLGGQVVRGSASHSLAPGASNAARVIFMVTARTKLRTEGRAGRAV